MKDAPADTPQETGDDARDAVLKSARRKSREGLPLTAEETRVKAEAKAERKAARQKDQPKAAAPKPQRPTGDDHPLAVPGAGPMGRAPQQQQPIVVRPLAKKAQVRKRHWRLMLGFVVMVLLPVVAAGWYLYDRAADQYASTVGFTVRSEDVSSAADILGGLGGALGGGSSGTDTDILYEFILSQGIVRKIDADLDLVTIYSRHYDRDPLLSFDPTGTIEDLTAFWRRMVRVAYDSGTGLIELRVLAFRPDDAEAIAAAIYDESQITINALSAIAREDATRYAAEDLTIALDRVKAAREELTAFRLENQIVDPEADIQLQMGLMSSLQEQQTAALIEFDLISETARAGDPRLDQAQRRLDVIDARLAEERLKFGASGQGPSGENYADTIAGFERLTVEREYAELSYAAALSALDAAKAEANRQSRYLAAYITPTLAQKSEFPQRGIILAVIALFAFLTWTIVCLVYYSLRDRR